MYQHRRVRPEELITTTLDCVWNGASSFEKTYRLWYVVTLSRAQEREFVVECTKAVRRWLAQKALACIRAVGRRTRYLQGVQYMTMYPRRANRNGMMNELLALIDEAACAVAVLDLRAEFSARVIQSRWRHVTSTPSHAMCKRRLMREWNELTA